jgi:hypothetical protein
MVRERRVTICKLLRLVADKPQWAHKIELINVDSTGQLFEPLKLLANAE